MIKPMQSKSHKLWPTKLTAKVGGAFLGIIFSVFNVPTAQASLGGDTASVETDRVAMKVEQSARQNLAPTGSYTIHETTLPSGTLVRQFVSSKGLVFAVAWSGPFLPDFRQLMGLHFDTMVAGQARQPNAGHRFFSLHEGDLVIESGGHQRSFAGRAFLRSAVPAGVTELEIK